MGVLHPAHICYLLNLAGVMGEGGYGLKENELLVNQQKPCRRIALDVILTLPLQVERVYKDAFTLMDQYEVLQFP